MLGLGLAPDTLNRYELDQVNFAAELLFKTDFLEVVYHVERDWILFLSSYPGMLKRNVGGIAKRPVDLNESFEELFCNRR